MKKISTCDLFAVFDLGHQQWKSRIKGEFTRFFEWVSRMLVVAAATQRPKNVNSPSLHASYTATKKIVL